LGRLSPEDKQLMTCQRPKAAAALANQTASSSPSFGKPLQQPRPQEIACAMSMTFNGKAAVDSRSKVIDLRSKATDDKENVRPSIPITALKPYIRHAIDNKPMKSMAMKHHRVSPPIPATAGRDIPVLPAGIEPSLASSADAHEPDDHRSISSLSDANAKFSSVHEDLGIDKPPVSPIGQMAPLNSSTWSNSSPSRKHSSCKEIADSKKTTVAESDDGAREPTKTQVLLAVFKPILFPSASAKKVDKGDAATLPALSKKETSSSKAEALDAKTMNSKAFSLKVSPTKEECLKRKRREEETLKKVKHAAVERRSKQLVQEVDMRFGDHGGSSNANKKARVARTQVAYQPLKVGMSTSPSVTKEVGNKCKKRPLPPQVKKMDPTLRRMFAMRRK